jgi:hypothetical protein
VTVAHPDPVAPAAAGAALPGETLQQAATAKDASDHRTLTVRLAPLPGDCRGTGVIEALDALGPAVRNDILCVLT